MAFQTLGARGRSYSNTVGPKVGVKLFTDVEPRGRCLWGFAIVVPGIRGPRGPHKTIRILTFAEDSV